MTTHRVAKFHKPRLRVYDYSLLRKAWLISGLTQQQIASAVESTQPTVTRVMRGQTASSRVVNAIADFLRVNREEVFSPVISVTPYDTFDEALRIANTGEYGLQVGIFTQNINRVMQAFSDMQVGGVQVNDIPTFRSDAMPYGGAKGSGLGREGPRYAIEEMSELRLMVINRDGGME